MVKYNNRLKSKCRLSLLAWFGAFALSACQTAPLPSASSTSTPITISKQTVIDAESQNTATTPQAESMDNRYPIDGDYQDNYPIDTINTIDTALEQNNAIEEANSYPIEPYTPANQNSTTPSYPTNSSADMVMAEPAYESTVYQQKAEQTAEPIVEPYDPKYNQPSSNSAIVERPSSSTLPAMPSHNELLERARQNSQQQIRQSTSDNSSLPAFRNLMDVGINQLKSGQLTAAENSFTRAQRMAPKSSAVYFYLAQVALKKGQPRKAEAMARRGLVVSEDSSRRRALWQIILQSGQAQNSTRVINEAKQALR